jgi:hypothetical protein
MAPGSVGDDGGCSILATFARTKEVEWGGVLGDALLKEREKERNGVVRTERS